ncbi:hypothetical protein QBC36DRAFT_294376 [Triangularia setosa]|uniref:NB-ARC domain-containing protein n=1 Tax=Triangularia setosa TaxID=2587417 RepID=A0AAN6W1D0_9PEZI|nr:hypothetical protein QBC36DRAFT_294376 [Podospora setosa]
MELGSDVDMGLLRDALFGDSGHERSFGIHGIEGVGKTQLALKAVDTLCHQFSHVFWIPAETELKLADSFRQIAVFLNLIDDSETDKTKSCRAVKHWLQENSQWLLVFDSSNANILRQYFPSLIQGSVITTSRSPAPAKGGVVSGAEILTFTCFDYELSFATCWSISIKA